MGRPSKERPAIEYKYKGTLNVLDTVREIRDAKVKKGKYNGHSKHLWRALELRNEGYDNYEIADKMSVESNTHINKTVIQQMFDNELIESNPEKTKNKRVSACEIILDRETFDKIDLESLKSGQTPTVLMVEMLGGEVEGKVYSDKRALRKIWEASYKHYYK